MIAIAPLALLASVVPSFLTYAYEEEHRFLYRGLPQERATILTIWDPRQQNGDYDCSLALPYPTMLVDFPNLRWIVLTSDDLDLSRIRDLKFDLLFSGSLALVDVEALSTPSFIARLKSTDRREDADHLLQARRGVA